MAKKGLRDVLEVGKGILLADERIGILERNDRILLAEIVILNGKLEFLDKKFVITATHTNTWIRFVIAEVKRIDALIVAASVPIGLRRLRRLRREDDTLEIEE